MVITLEQLENLLDQQKRITTNHLLGKSAHYNKESYNGVFNTLPINVDSFKEIGMEAPYPDDVITLRRYN